MEVGVCLVADEPLRRIAALAARAGSAGLTNVWVTDNQNSWRDVWTALTVIGTSTRRVTIGPMVTNPQTRHPTVTAAAAAGIDELTGRRLVLGLGKGRASLTEKLDTYSRRPRKRCNGTVRQWRAYTHDSGDEVAL